MMPREYNNRLADLICNDDLKGIVALLTEIGGFEYEIEILQKKLDYRDKCISELSEME